MLASSAYQAYCGQDGYTLAARIDGSSATFRFASSLWNTSALLNYDAVEVTQVSEAKLQPFNDQRVQQIRIVIKDPTSGVAGVPLDLTLPQSYPSLLSLFQSGAAVDTDADKASWAAAVPAPGVSLQPYCGQQGLNQCVGCSYPYGNQYRARIMYAANDQNDCLSADSGVGIGILPWGYYGTPAVPVAGSFSPGGASSPKDVWIFVRELYAPTPSPSLPPSPGAAASPSISPSPAPGTPWSPYGLSGLTAWLRPEELPPAGGSVPTWRGAVVSDVSSGVTLSATASTGAPVSVLNASFGPSGVYPVMQLTSPTYGGLTCAGCTGQSLTLPLHWSSHPELSLFMLARLAPGTLLRRTIASRDNDWSLFTRSGRYDTINDGVSGSIEFGTDVSTVDPAVNASTMPLGWTLWSAVIGLTASNYGTNGAGGATNAIWRNGTLRRSSQMYASQGPSTLSIGGVKVGSNGEYTSMSIAEVLVVDRAVASQERERIEVR